MNLPNVIGELKSDELLYQKTKQAWEKKRPLPDFSRTSLFKGLLADEKLNQKAHREYGREDLLDIGIIEKMPTKDVGKSVNQALNKYSEEKVTAQTLRGLTDWLCEMFDFTYIEGGALYIYDDDYLRWFSNAFAGRFLTQVFWEYDVNYPLRSTDYKEIVRLLQAQPQIIKRQDECRTNQDCILFEDAAFDVATQTMREPRLEDYQFSKINFPLQWGRECRASLEAREFIERFCAYDPVQEDYLWELIGYLLSSYQKKIIVVFWGPSNSGKSTLANMIRRICGTETCVALGVKELSGNFSLAELQGKRLCIDSEMDASVLNARDINLLKKVVGGDLIQGNRKHEQQFYFQCQTKFLICTNNKIKFRSDEDTISFFNRLRFFELKESIPVEEQCYEMDKILDENRTYFLQKAMEGLCRLVSSNFVFSWNEPAENFVENTKRQADVRSVCDFVTVCCECNENAMETVADLYEAYQQFALDNGRDEVSKKIFCCFLAENYEVHRYRTGEKRFFKGIRIVTHDR